MQATTKYAPPRIERRETLPSALVIIAISGGLSAAFRPATYEPPRIESREPLEGALQTLSSPPPV
jgi:hypothetical protein